MMEHTDIQGQVDQLRDHIEDLRSKVDQSYEVLQNIQTTLSDLQSQVGQRRMETPSEANQPMAPIRLVGRNLWMISAMLTIAVSVIAYLIFSPPPPRRVAPLPKGMWSTILGRR